MKTPALLLCTKLPAALTVVLATVLLTACGGGGGGRDHGPGPGNPPAPPPPMTDAFTVAVMSLIASAPDDTEPTDPTTVALTTPEDSEPESVN